MKKVIFSIGLCLCVGFSAMAQMVVVEEAADPAVTNKRGVPILPKAGDFALGIDATPFFTYLGDFFGKVTNGGSPAFTNDFGIYGKYFLQDNQAIRVGLGLGLGNDKFIGTVLDQTDNTNQNFGEDVLKKGETKVNLFVGYEFRRGRGRVQGFYGGGLNLGVASSKDKYEYFNSFSSTYTTPISTTNFITGASSPVSSRTTESKGGTAFSVGLGGFVGVEYFFAPQMSIGGEFNLALGFSNTGKGKMTTEYWDAANNSVKTNTSESRHGETGYFKFETNNGHFGTTTSGSIFLMFYF